MTLNDTQLVLLTTAAARDGGSLMPLSTCLRARDARIDKVVSGLIRQGLVAERTGVTPSETWSSDDEVRTGLFVTPQGLEAIGVSIDESDQPMATVGTPDGAPAPLPPHKPTSKQDAVIALLVRAEGASLEDMIAATGWLPHSARAVLTGLRKKGHQLSREKVGEESRYFIKVEA